MTLEFSINAFWNIVLAAAAIDDEGRPLTDMEDQYICSVHQSCNLIL